MPIGYYTFLRIVVFAGSLLAIYNEYEGKITGWIITFGLIGVLFNPIIPVYLHDKVIWIVIDIVAAIIFAVKASQTQPH